MTFEKNLFSYFRGSIICYTKNDYNYSLIWDWHLKLSLVTVSHIVDPLSLPLVKWHNLLIIPSMIWISYRIFIPREMHLKKYDFWDFNTIESRKYFSYQKPLWIPFKIAEYAISFIIFQIWSYINLLPTKQGWKKTRFFFFKKTKKPGFFCLNLVFLV